MTPNIIRRPMLSIQCDWDEVLRTKDGTAWVSCKEQGCNSKHGKLKCVVVGNGLHEIQESDGFKVVNVTKYYISLTHDVPQCRCTFFAPQLTLANIHAKGVQSIDVTAGGLGVSVCTENKLRVWDTRDGSVLRNLVGHIFDIYTCRFFPSGMVILSAGADMLMKVWAADKGICPVTFKGHTAAITATAIVDRGKNVVSVAKDGTAKLWDCGSSSCIATITEGKGSINTCDIANIDINLGIPDAGPSPLEVSTEGKLLLVGSEHGSLYGIGLRSHKQIFECKSSSAVNCCCFLSSHSAVFGTQDGSIYLIEINNASKPKTVWEESASAVLCLLPVPNGFFAGRADGSCGFIGLNGESPIQLTGSGFDPVYCIASDGKYIFTGCRDGTIRKYNVPSNSENIFFS